MKNYYIKIAIWVVTKLTSRRVVERIKDLVFSLMDQDIPGAQKKLALDAMINDAIDSVAVDIKSIAPSLINLVIEAVVVWTKNEYGRS